MGDRILGIACSLRVNGNTEILVREALKGAESEGADTELLTLVDRRLEPCDGCLVCEEKGVCHKRDDMQLICKKLVEADGIIFGVPVYFWSMCGQAKILIDRTYPLLVKSRLMNRRGGLITVGGRKGCVSTANVFSMWFMVNRMIFVDFVDGYARTKGEIVRDRHAMASSLELGKLLTRMVKKPFEYPEEYRAPLYRYVRSKYDLQSGR